MEAKSKRNCIINKLNSIQKTKKNKDDKSNDDDIIEPPIVPFENYKEATSITMDEAKMVIKNIQKNLKKQNVNKIDEDNKNNNNEDNKDNNEIDIELIWKHNNHIGFDYLQKIILNVLNIIVN